MYKYTLHIKYSDIITLHFLYLPKKKKNTTKYGQISFSPRLPSNLHSLPPPTTIAPNSSPKIIPLAPNVQDSQESFFKPLQFFAKVAMPASVNSQHARSLRWFRFWHRSEMRTSASSPMLTDLQSHFSASFVWGCTKLQGNMGLNIEGYPVEGLSTGGHETCIIFQSLHSPAKLEQANWWGSTLQIWGNRGGGEEFWVNAQCRLCKFGGNRSMGEEEGEGEGNLGRPIRGGEGNLGEIESGVKLHHVGFKLQFDG